MGRVPAQIGGKGLGTQQAAGGDKMVSRNHNNRSEKQKGHTEDKAGHGDAGDARNSNDGADTPRGDGGGGAPRAQGRGQANRQEENRKQNRGHGGHP